MVANSKDFPPPPNPHRAEDSSVPNSRFSSIAELKKERIKAENDYLDTVLARIKNRILSNILINNSCIATFRDFSIPDCPVATKTYIEFVKQIIEKEGYLVEYRDNFLVYYDELTKEVAVGAASFEPVFIISWTDSPDVGQE